MLRIHEDAMSPTVSTYTVGVSPKGPPHTFPNFETADSEYNSNTLCIVYHNYEKVL